MRIARFTLIATLLAFAVAPATARAQSNAKEIMSKKPAELVEILKNPNATIFEKAKACQRLAVVGTKDAVPALSALLADEKLNEYARFGLEGIPDPAVDEALRDAACKLHGRPLVGVVDSIGQRRDAKAVKLLSKLIVEEDVAVASAAAGALGRIGTPAAADTLMMAVAADSPIHAAAADACLACAERLAKAGKIQDAGMLCGIVRESIDAMDKKDVPKYLRAAAISGSLRIWKEVALERLLKELQSPEKMYFNAGLAAARQMPGAEVTAALAGAVQKLPPDRQALLLLAIGDRKDAAPASLFLSASKCQFPEVREAAIRVFVKRGDAGAVTTLLDAALGEATLAQIAKDGLVRLPGREVDKAICDRLAASDDAKAKVVLLGLIGARQIVTARPAVREAMSGTDPAVRLAALAAMAQLIEVKDLDLLIDRALWQQGNMAAPVRIDAAKAALETAAKRMGDRDACAAKLAEHVKGASAANRLFLFEVLCKVSGKKALAVVVEGAKSADPATKDAATRVLGEWVNTDAAPALLEIAKNDPEKKYQIRALRGYIRIARQLEIPWWEASNAGETKLTMFDNAMAVARRNEEKRLALDILTRIPSAATLDRATAHLGDPAIRDAAADAAVKIANQVVGNNPKAVAAAMQKVIAAGAAGEVGNRAKQLLDQGKAASK
jgi:HEAT repeat protein